MSWGNPAEPRQSGRTAMRWSEEERRKGKGRTWCCEKKERKEVEVIGDLFGQNAEKWKREGGRRGWRDSRKKILSKLAEQEKSVPFWQTRLPLKTLQQPSQTAEIRCTIDRHSSRL